MIPKIIHFIWLGPRKKNRLIKKCMHSWCKLHPNWEIVEWNNQHFHFNECTFVKMAYKDKNWAYLSDYYRLNTLNLHGGIYLDTDMLVIKPLDKLLNNSFFCGYETENMLSCGIIGAEKGHNFTQNILNYYNLLDTANWHKESIPRIFTKVYSGVEKDDIKIYPIDYFYPYPAESRLNEININYKKYITPNTMAIHMWEYSWSFYSRYQLFLKDKLFMKALLSFVKEAFTESKTFKWKEFSKTLFILLGKQ